MNKPSIPLNNGVYRVNPLDLCMQGTYNVYVGVNQGAKHRKDWTDETGMGRKYEKTANPTCGGTDGNDHGMV